MALLDEQIAGAKAGREEPVLAQDAQMRAVLFPLLFATEVPDEVVSEIVEVIESEVAGGA